MRAYKKIIFEDDAPEFPLVVSPVAAQVWKLESGLFTHRVDSILDMRKFELRGIHSAKTPEEDILKDYNGALVELEIGGTVIEGEKGYRSSEAAIIKVIHRALIDNFVSMRVLVYSRLEQLISTMYSGHVEYFIESFARRGDFRILNKINESITFGYLSSYYNAQCKEKAKIAARTISESPALKHYRQWLSAERFESRSIRELGSSYVINLPTLTKSPKTGG